MSLVSVDGKRSFGNSDVYRDVAKIFKQRLGKPIDIKQLAVAELASAFLYPDPGISKQPCYEHASHVKSWTTNLRENNKAIFKAASLATKASNR